MRTPLLLTKYRSMASLLLFLLALTASSTTIAKSQIDKGDEDYSLEGLKLIDEIQYKLKAIRTFIGKPVSETPKIEIKGAVAREVFYQAVNLYQKADRLSQEIARDTKPFTADESHKELTTEDVLSVIKHAKERIQRVVDHLKIRLDPYSAKSFQPDQKTQSALYASIVETNQQINQLLELKFSPSDVYQQVTTALLVSQALYEHFPEARRIYEEPHYIPNKVPSDVFKLLLDCYSLVRDIAASSNINILEIASVHKTDPYVPSEVFDIATLLVSELRYIQDSLVHQETPAKSYFPGRKYPSDVYQRASYLQSTLTDLRDLIDATPNWHAKLEDTQ